MTVSMLCSLSIVERSPLRCPPKPSSFCGARTQNSTSLRWRRLFTTKSATVSRSSMTMTLANFKLLVLGLFAGARELQHLKLFPFRDANQSTNCDSSILIACKLFNAPVGPTHCHRVNLGPVTKTEIEPGALLRRESGTRGDESREFF